MVFYMFRYFKFKRKQLKITYILEYNNTFLKTTYFDEDTQCTELLNDH